MAHRSRLQRWIRFNGVGGLGMGLQLGLLAALVHGLDVHYLAATALAVEGALLHNFFWHERWTWRDCPSGTGRHVAVRLGRFHLLNGVISLGGNLSAMWALTGFLGVPPVGANLIAIALCSVINFSASDRLVFTRAAALAAFVFAPGVPAVSRAAPLPPKIPPPDLQAHTLQDWTAYERQVDERYHAAAPAARPFFALDAFHPEAGWRPTTRTGGVAMAQIPRARPGGPDGTARDGKIHHWAGAVFVPNASLDTVLARVSALAGREQDHYEDVVRSRLLTRDGSRYRIFMRLRRSNVVTVTYDTEHEVQSRRMGATRAGARSVATRIAELESAGTAQERQKPPGSDSGYLWRLNAYWRYEATDGGVMIECESVSLSRSIPMVFRPFVTGMVERVARDSLERTLVGLRRTLTST